MDFQMLGMKTNVIDGLKKQNIVEPTKVQVDTYEKIVEGQDMIVQSQTGSGKTLAYLLPLYEKYKDLPHTNKVIILVPTKELALQVHKQVELLSANSGIEMKSEVIFGNVNIKRQVEYLRAKPQIIIGTAARITELIKMKKIAAHNVKTIILDEADKMLDKKNIETTKALIKCTMKDRQMLFFSASMPAQSIRIATELSKEPMVLRHVEKQVVPEDIEHLYIVVRKNEKIETLRKIISIEKEKQAMIFLNGAFYLEEATKKLQYHKYEADCLQGSQGKLERKKVMEGFRSGKIKYLLATDVAARGLQFDGIQLVVHLDVPENTDDYLHRAGRTGRNGIYGISIMIMTPGQANAIPDFSKKLGIKMKQVKVKEGAFVPVVRRINENNG